MNRLALLLLGVGPALVAASDEVPRIETKTMPDWVVTVNARRALWSDSSLAGLNLGVKVKAGEALVWGPVINEQQSAEAIARIKLVPGVEVVVNELYILPTDDVLRMKLPTFPPAPPKVLVKPLPGNGVTGPTNGSGVRAIASRPEDLIEDVRQTDRRYRDLRVQFVNGLATVTGSAPAAADAVQFAETIRQLPGVNRVLLRTGAGDR